MCGRFAKLFNYSSLSPKALVSTVTSSRQPAQRGCTGNKGGGKTESSWKGNTDGLCSDRAIGTHTSAHGPSGREDIRGNVERCGFGPERYCWDGRLLNHSIRERMAVTKTIVKNEKHNLFFWAEWKRDNPRRGNTDGSATRCPYGPLAVAWFYSRVRLNYSLVTTKDKINWILE